MKQFDAIVLGGGFYGCCVAILLSQHYSKVALVEKENNILQKASAINQARVHGGYHYPRSFITAARSLANYPKFLRDFSEAIIDDVAHIYAIARDGSKTNAKQFYSIFKKLGAYIRRAPSNVTKEIFSPELIEDAFIVHEAIFDWSILRNIILTKLQSHGIHLILNEEVKNVASHDEKVIVNTFANEYVANHAISCLYSKLNLLQVNSELPLLPLKHELTELALVEPPDSLKKYAITVMDGHFFSLMPYPEKSLYALSHVRYTPRASWIDQDVAGNISSKINTKNWLSHYIYMQRDAMRYIPSLKELHYVKSMYETKTILQRNEIDDGRPILFREEPTLPNFYNILGSKIDNVYDILDVISEQMLIKSRSAVEEFV